MLQKLLKTAIPLALFLFSCSLSGAQPFIGPPYTEPNWSKAYEPFRIAGNLYYVGTYDLASYLITTSEGHILINTGLAESVPMIRSNIEALGFRFGDIKVLLVTHAHFDHTGGIAEIKKLTGAKMLVQQGDAAALQDGGNLDYAFGGKGSTFAPVKPDQLLRGNDTIKLGTTQIVALQHAGHTKGANSFLFVVKDEQRSYRVLIANMPTVVADKLSDVPAYPQIANDYANTFVAMKKLNFDIWLASHASQFGLHNKRKPGGAYNPGAFTDRKSYDLLLDRLQKEYLKKLNE